MIWCGHLCGGTIVGKRNYVPEPPYHYDATARMVRDAHYSWVLTIADDVEDVFAYTLVRFLNEGERSIHQGRNRIVGGES